MKTKHTFIQLILFFVIALAIQTRAQVPVANFSVSPNPICAGSIVQVTDLSTNAPSSWSYTLSQGGPGIGPPQLSTVQNPTVAYNNAGTYTLSLISTNASGASVVVSHTIVVLASPNAIINPPNQNTCIGGNAITLNCNVPGGGGATNTFLWSNGASTQSISVSPTVTTTYTCVVTATNGCNVTRTTTVSIANPTIILNSVPASICPGSSSTLTAASSGPGPWTYTWSNSATTNTIVTNVSGVYNVTVTNANNCKGVQTYSLGTSSTLSLTATSNPSVLCAGNTGTLHITGASSYTWNTGSSAVNLTVNPTSNTTYSVVGQFGTCTGTTAITLNVSVTPTLTVASSSPSLCSGKSATLTANGASTYTWNPGGFFTSSIVASPSVSTTYTLRGVNTGCNARTTTLSLSVVPSPQLVVSNTPSVICSGENAALAISGAATYSWSNGSTGGVVLITPTITTSYTVTGTATNGCSTTTQITQNVSDCTAIHQTEIKNSGIVIFPNPNNGEFSINSTENSSVTIVNQMGAVVKTIYLNESNKSAEVFGLSSGIYFLITNNNGVRGSQKIIVTK